MRRRVFIALVGGAAIAWPVAARTQQAERVRRIGVLMTAAEGDPLAPAQAAALRDGLKDRGWVEGRNIQIEFRWTGGRANLFREYASELVAMPAEVIVSQSAPALVALRNTTGTIPIVFYFVSDPVGMGVVKELARPGGNITGFTAFEPSLGGKWLELIKEIAPGVTRAGIVFNPNTAPNAPFFLRAAEAAGPALGVSIVATHLREDAEIESVIREFGQQPGGALILVPDPFTAARWKPIVAAATQHRLPLIAPFRSFADAGAILSYGINSPEQGRRAATYVDRILRGEKPGELPIQAPTKFELVINLKTAKAFGLTVPQSLLLRADEVIE